MEIAALVVGATGIAGRGVSQELLDAGAGVHGLSRRRDGIVTGVEHRSADLLDSLGFDTSALHALLIRERARILKEESSSESKGPLKDTSDEKPQQKKYRYTTYYRVLRAH